jgi:hypothetical protein
MMSEQLLSLTSVEIEVNFCGMQKPTNFVNDEMMTEVEHTSLERGATMAQTEFGYALEHATRPSTIGFALVQYGCIARMVRLSL